MPGRTMPVDNEATVFAELPATACRYTSTPFMDSATACNGLGHDATVCANEYGVVMIMSITSFSNAAALRADEAMQFDTVNYPYYRFKELTTLCVEKDDRPIYGIPVRAYWHEAETVMIRDLKTVLHTAQDMKAREQARKYLTLYCNRLQDKAFSDAGQLLNDVRWYHSQNSNTMKNGRNPETHEILDSLKPIPPLPIRLDAGEWQSMLSTLDASTQEAGNP